MIQFVEKRRESVATRNAEPWSINIQPSFFGMPIDHPQLYPVYAKAAELGLGVGVHKSTNPTSGSASTSSRWR